MFPIRDHNPSGRTPYVTYALITVNIAVFLSYAGMDDRAINGFFYDWAIIPRQVSSGEGWVTLFTSMFLHAGLAHLGGNMLFLWIFGDNLEDKMGHRKFFTFYVLSGLAAGLVHVLAAPGSVVPTVGASGAIAGVMGGYLLLFPKAKVDILIILIVFFRVIPVPAWLMLMLWFGMQFLGGIGADPNTGGVAYWAHAGGFVAGFLLTIPTWRRLGGKAFWDRTHGVPPHPVADYRSVTTRIPKVRRR